ncbi:unnamed protein product, partial [Rotaria socialis]
SCTIKNGGCGPKAACAHDATTNAVECSRKPGYTNRGAASEIKRRDTGSASGDIRTANLPAACSSYTNISDPTRSVRYSGSSGCDSSSFSSSGMWVRFTGSGGTTIPTYAPGPSVCGTDATGWYITEMPSSGATVSGALCYQSTINKCHFYSAMQVTNCNTYYVYFLYPPPTCNLRVCTV